MNTNYEYLARKAVEVAPDWLKNDIKEIVNKDSGMSESYIVGKLHELYSFSLKHIFVSFDSRTDWAELARFRLTFIDNNLDVVNLLIQKHKKELINEEKK